MFTGLLRWGFLGWIEGRLLGIVFDDWDERLGVRLDRELICEMIIRYVLSEILVPEAAGRRLFPVRVKKLLGALIMGSTSRTRR